MNRYKSAIALTIACFLLSPTTASATLLDGEIVEYQYLFDTITTPYPFADNGNKLVGPGIEVTSINDGLGTLDISDTNLLVVFTVPTSSYYGEADFNGFRITDIFGTIPSFAGVKINPATNMVGLDASRITFDDDHIWVNWSLLDFTPDTIVSLDIIAVPEPSNLALITLGLLCLVFRQRA